MKNAIEFAKKFNTFRKKLPTVEKVAENRGVIEEVIYAHLLWNATYEQATVAYENLIAAAVDLNELRVNHVMETVELIGANYPQAQERAKRLRSVLNAIYLREHNVAVPSLAGAGKRDIRDYFETLIGMTPFVCNRVIALCFGVAAIPVDDRTLAALISNEVVHEDVDVHDATIWLIRQVKAVEVIDFHAKLHKWGSEQPIRTVSKPSKKTIKKIVSKKTVTKKPITKKAVTKKKVAKKTTAKKIVEVKKKTSKKKVAKKVLKKVMKKKTKK